MQHRRLVLALPFLLAAAPAGLAAQEPATWRLVRVGADPLPVVMSAGDDGRPLLQLVEETLTVGPGERIARVTVMRADVYERMPCTMVAQLREMERRRGAGDSSRTPPPAPADTTVLPCADLRASRDSVVGRVREDGGQRWVEFESVPGRTREPRALLVQRGDALELRLGVTSATDKGGLVMRYARSRGRR